LAKFILDFDDQWITWMRICFAFANFIILVNGDGVDPIVLDREFQQGDQILLYLFIICMEDLSCLLEKA